MHSSLNQCLMVLVCQIVPAYYRYDPHPLKNQKVNWCLEMIEVCVVEALEITLNSEEEVREASWRGNQAGLSLEGEECIHIQAKKRTWPVLGTIQSLGEPGRARGARRAYETSGEVGRGGGLMLGHWVFLWNKEELLKFMNLLAKHFRDGSREPIGKLCQ